MGKNDYKGPRHGASRSRGGSRPKREPLRDSYYYEEPPRGWKEGDGFQDISSYSSPQKRRADQRAAKSAQAKSGRKACSNSRDIYSSAAPARKKGSLAKKLAAVLAVLVVLVGAGFAYVFGYVLADLKMTSLTQDPEALGIYTGTYSDPQVINIALFGLDAREDTDEGRSDALMVLTVDKRRNKLKLTSILRDSEVYIDGYGWDKITHAYAYGGPELAVKTLNQNFGLDIKSYVTVNFFQMAEIVDAFGGVELELTAEEMYEINANLWALSQEQPDAVTWDDYLPSVSGQVELVYGQYQGGTYRLNGAQAVAYARIRHIDSDDARASRQQQVVMALVKQLKSKSIFAYPGLIRKVTSICETSLGVGDMLGMAPLVLTGFEMETLSIPGGEEQAYGAYTDAGTWVYEYDLTAASQHISRFIYEQESPYYTGAE